MHLRRRGSLTPSIESDPKFPPPAIESDPKARFRMGMLGGNKAFSASVDIIQTAGPAGAAEHSFNGEDETMQMMRLAVRKRMIAQNPTSVVPANIPTSSPAPNHLQVLDEEPKSPPTPPADPRSAFKKNALRRKFSESMPAHVMRTDVSLLDESKTMGNIIKGLDELSEDPRKQSVCVRRYIEFMCDKLGLDGEKLSCMQRLKRSQPLTNSCSIAEGGEGEEKELSVEDMLND